MSTGLTGQRLYPLEREPGPGKTTLGLQLLNQGARQGESVLYIALAETAGIHVEDIIPNKDILDPDRQYTIFHD